MQQTLRTMLEKVAAASVITLSLCLPLAVQNLLHAVHAQHKVTSATHSHIDCSK